MMVSSQSYYFSCIVTLLFFFLVSVVQYTLAAPTPHYCRHDQRDALLEFKHEFPGNGSKQIDYAERISFSSWNKSSDCCSWEGVKCDAKSGQVISLSLYNSILNSSLKTNSSLFKLQYLQSLSLRYCDLYGEIPSSLGNLSHLTVLDLSYNQLVGQVPTSLRNLSHLTVLDLQNNKLVGQVPVSLGNLSHLTWLDLSCNNLVGQIPVLLGHLSHLTFLDFSSNELVGQVPASLGNLSHLTSLFLSSNQLVGQIPASLGNLSHLTSLFLSFNQFVGQIPASLGNLSHLTWLHLSHNHLVGQVPASLGNLSQLEFLELNFNNFTGNVPLSFANLAKLADLDISNNRFTIGNFLSSLLPNLTRLYALDISSNNFQSKFPHDMRGLHNLNSFYASYNSFFGPFPKSLFNNPSLLWVDLGGNQFKGPIEFGNTSSSSSLEYLVLADNNFTGPIPTSISKLVELSWLDLSNNNLEGQVPGCLRRLWILELSYNAFSSFGISYEAPDDSIFQDLRLNSNSFQGPFPHWICNHRYLRLLDLSNNLFNGSIPPCLRNSTSSLEVLVLSNNSLSGILLPDIFVGATYLRVLDVSHNQLEGKLPRSLINCTSMQLLNVGRNKIKDEFPSWLGSSQVLKLLLLRSNQFYGSLYHRHVSIGFQSLGVIDVSHNDFTGTLPPFYFSNWLQMTRLGEHPDNHYSNDDQYVGVINNSSYSSSMEMVNKGVDLEFERIHRDYKAIDFSGNRLWGNIPESIGLLKSLHLLNLSGNAFTGNIPPSLENLINLETLDLSRNRLSGQISRGLGKLSSLSSMNFSYNNLEGPIPRGQQFQSQDCSSFMNNTRLSGLEEICVQPHHVPNPTPQESEEIPQPEEQVINWLAAAIAYGPGVLCGLVIGHVYARGHKVKSGRNKRRVVTTSAR